MNGDICNSFFEPQIFQSGRVGLAPPLIYDWYKYAHKKGRAKLTQPFLGYDSNAKLLVLFWPADGPDDFGSVAEEVLFSFEGEDTALHCFLICTEVLSRPRFPKSAPLFPQCLA